MTQLQTRNLSLSAGNKCLLRNLDVCMHGGERWIILGANGSGKTTLLHALAGLRQANSGSILLNGEEMEHISHRQRAQTIGILFQDYESVFPGSVIETVLASRYPFSSWAQLLGDSEDDVRIARAALKELDLEGLASRSMTSLSGGERRRVQIAALMAQTTPIRLLDEPTNHLDLKHQVHILDIAKRPNPNADSSGDKDNLNIMVLHDINQALAYGTHGILIYANGVTASGCLADIVDKKSLEELYDCPLKEIQYSGNQYYLPG